MSGRPDSGGPPRGPPETQPVWYGALFDVRVGPERSDPRAVLSRLIRGCWVAQDQLLLRLHCGGQWSTWEVRLR
jgi:hypothetical protein